MYCIHCGAQIEEDAKFCTNCGEKVEPKVSVPTVKPQAKPVSENKNLNAITDHLEFLGYSIELIKPEKKGGRELVLARHDKLNNIAIFDSLPGFVMFQVSLQCERFATPEADAYVNKSNRLLDISRVYYNEEEGNMVIKFEAMYIGGYDKEVFAKFHSMFEKDQQRFATQEDFAGIFLAKK